MVRSLKNIPSHARRKALTRPHSVDQQQLTNRSTTTTQLQQKPQSRGFFGSMAESVASGLGFGVGMRLLDGIMGPRSMEVVHRGEEQGAQNGQQTNSNDSHVYPENDRDSTFGGDALNDDNSQSESWFGGDNDGGSWFSDE